jgi:hypothetical protein
MKELLKSTIGLFFIILVISPYIIKTAVLVDFYIHQEEIRAQYCIERFAENSCCQGQCVLQKELQKTEGHTEHWPQLLKEKIEVVYEVQTIEHLSFIYPDTHLIHSTAYQPLISEASLSCIIHPPCC